MVHYQAYRLWIEELDALLAKGDVKMPLEWWDQDQMHLRTQADYFDEKEEPYRGTRSLDEENRLIDAMKDDGRNHTEVGDQLIFDYLDGIIDWNIFYGFFSGYPVYDELNEKSEDERRRFLWLERYNPNGCPL